jgi:hypothetical protein
MRGCSRDPDVWPVVWLLTTHLHIYHADSPIFRYDTIAYAYHDIVQDSKFAVVGCRYSFPSMACSNFSPRAPLYIALHQYVPFPIEHRNMCTEISSNSEGDVNS